MTAVEHLAFVGHHPQVIGVAKKQAELVERERAFFPLRRWTGREALLRKLLAKHRHAVLPRRVLLEGPPDERSPLGVDVDGVHQAPVEVPAHVEVADLGPASGPAAHRLVEHLLLDVLAALPDLDFIHDVCDGLHGVGHVALPEVLFSRDELHAHARQNALGNRSVGEIAEGSGAHVDDDVADLWMLLDVPQHLPEYGALADRLRRVAGLHELRGDRRPRAFRTHKASFALGRDGIAIRIDVDRGQHLTRRGHAEVDDRLAITRINYRSR
nr:hypothetical protein [Microbacterium sp.]